MSDSVKVEVRLRSGHGARKEFATHGEAIQYIDGVAKKGNLQLELEEADFESRPKLLKYREVRK